jgi:hypothetical protein
MVFDNGDVIGFDGVFVPEGVLDDGPDLGFVKDLGVLLMHLLSDLVDNGLSPAKVGKVIRTFGMAIESYHL